MPPPSPGHQKVNVYVHRDTWRRFRVLCTTRGVSASAALVAHMEQDLADAGLAHLLALASAAHDAPQAAAASSTSGGGERVRGIPVPP